MNKQEQIKYIEKECALKSGIHSKRLVRQNFFQK